MKLKRFNAETCPQLVGAKGKRSLSINHKGHVLINGLAVTTMGLKPGDKISIVQDQDHPEDWYITKDPNGFELRHKSGNTLMTQSTAMCIQVLNCMEFTGKHNYHFPIAGTATIFEKHKYWGILTNAATWKGKI